MFLKLLSRSFHNFVARNLKVLCPELVLKIGITIISTTILSARIVCIDDSNVFLSFKVKDFALAKQNLEEDLNRVATSCCHNQLAVD